MKIGLWKKETNNLLSHGEGLTEEQVEFLQSLKPGDRLICWYNKDSSEDPKRATYTLKKFEPKGDR